MEAIKLQSMTDFIDTHLKTGCTTTQIQMLHRYKDFLKQPLKLGMFVPCDKNGNILKGKPLSPAPDSEWIRWENEEFEFYEAREQVLFKYFKVVEYSDNTIEIVSDTAPNFIIPFKKLSNKDWEQRYNHIEDLLKSIIEIQLTETAIKQIGL